MQSLVKIVRGRDRLCISEIPFDAGIGYAQGPWTFAVAGIYSEDDDSNDELLAGSASVNYNLAPGVSVFLSGFVGEEDFGAGGNNDIASVTSGMKVSF